MSLYVLAFETQARSAVLFFLGASTRYLFRAQREKEREMDILLDVGVR